MPPRYAYWTILIDNGPTAFRAREQSELLPTLQQLRRTNQNVVMKWFARGRLWESPEEARAAAARPRPREQRDSGWRPGGDHRDPRERFAKGRARKARPQGAGARADRPALRSSRPPRPRPPKRRTDK